MSAIVIPEALRARFLERLAIRVTTLESTIAALDEKHDLRASLERQLHSLAGIAGTYGFHALTDLARAGELQCAAGAPRVTIEGVIAQIAEAAATAREARHKPSS